MRQKIKHQSIPEALADEVEKAIRRGRWSKYLPGCRELAEEYIVSKRSSTEALVLLEKRGVIHPAEPGKRRQVRSKAGQKRRVDSKELLVVSCERSRIGSEDFDLINTHVNHWLGREGTVRSVRVDMTHSRSCKKVVARWLEDHKPGAFLVTLGPRPWLQAMADTGLPMYCFGGEIGKVMDRISGCGYELKDALDEVMGELRRRGHTRVLFPMRAGWKVFEKDVLAAGKKHFGDLHSEGELNSFCVRFAEESPETWRDGWHRYLPSLRPTAVICEKEAELLSLYLYCASAGVRIPEDLSVVSLVNSWMTGWLWPRPTLLRFPYKKAERHFQQWVRSNLSAGNFQLFAPEWEEGQSLRSLG